MVEILDDALHGPSALPIIVKADGTFETSVYPPARLEDYAPESINVDWSGSWDMPDVLETHERDAISGVENGWRVLTGWAGPGTLFIFDANRQHFGSDLEERILEEPGLWAIVPVEMQPPVCEAENDGMPCRKFDKRGTCKHVDDRPDESKAAGWALVHKEIPA